MKRTSGSPRTERTRSAAGYMHRSARSLDATAREAIELFTLLLARRSYDREAVWSFFKQCLQQIPEDVGLAAVELKTELRRALVAGHVLTRWHLVPRYVENGAPKPLPARGPDPSIASIVAAVGGANPEDVLSYLLSSGTVEQVGNHYVPLSRILSHRRAPPVQRLHHLRFAIAVLRTLERNARAINTPRAYQFSANGRIPVSQCTAHGEAMWEASDQLLMVADTDMFRRALTRKRGERSIDAMLGIFSSVGGPLPPLAQGGKRPRRTQEPDAK